MMAPLEEFCKPRHFGGTEPDQAAPFLYACVVRPIGGSMIHVFIVGSKGIPAQYGGFETFVENLTARKTSADLFYHVSCMNNEEKHFSYNGADCFNVRVPMPGAPGRIFHVGRVLSEVETWCRANPEETCIVYILGCRIGPLLIPHARRLHRMGAKIFCNPDGLEWKRDKWNALEKRFLHYCERCLVKNSDLSVCDSKNIERYIVDTYGNAVKTTYIAYGADAEPSHCSDEKRNEWFGRFGLQKDSYYLIIGRFVPENNYETMIREYMASKTERTLVIITNVEQNAFYEQLKNTTHFDEDPRIRFVGTVYDAELLKRIREEAHGYLHGHEVGGTNPSLLEALASTKVNLLLNVGFNREVGEDGALYWSKEPGSLAELLSVADGLTGEQIESLHREGRERILRYYNWKDICFRYEELFLDGQKQESGAVYENSYAN